MENITDTYLKPIVKEHLNIVPRSQCFQGFAVTQDNPFELVFYVFPAFFVSVNAYDVGCASDGLSNTAQGGAGFILFHNPPICAHKKTGCDVAVPVLVLRAVRFCFGYSSGS